MIRNPRHRSRFATKRVASQEQLKVVLDQVNSMTQRFIESESNRLYLQVNKLLDHLPVEELDAAYLAATGRELNLSRFHQAYLNLNMVIEDYSEVIYSMLRDIENEKH